VLFKGRGIQFDNFTTKVKNEGKVKLSTLTGRGGQ
jgi:hypothetical protein